MTFRVTFWGVRGSIAAPGRRTARYGGNTPCVGIAGDHDTLLVLDAGTGCRQLGDSLTRSGSPAVVDFLLSHVHWDHIQGLPFFGPMYRPGYRIGIHGPAPEGRRLEEVLRMQMDEVMFPVPLSRVAAEVAVHELDIGSHSMGPWNVDCFPVAHPGTTFGYRVGTGLEGPSLAYLTDCELGSADGHGMGNGWYDALVERLENVDILIHDSMYTDEMIADRSGWGHSSPAQAVALARACGARRLVLFHHDPSHDDESLDRIGAAAESAAASSPGLTVTMAREEQSIEVGAEP